MNSNLINTLNTTNSQQEATQSLQGLKVSELKEIAANYDVFIRGMKKAEIVAKIVMMVVDSRIRAELIIRG